MRPQLVELTFVDTVNANIILCPMAITVLTFRFTVWICLSSHVKFLFQESAEESVLMDEPFMQFVMDSKALTQVDSKLNTLVLWSQII